MPKYIVQKSDGSLGILYAEGFVPEGNLGQAPENANAEDFKKVGSVVSVDMDKKEAREGKEELAKQKMEAEQYIASTNQHIIDCFELGLKPNADVLEYRNQARSILGK